jgi:HTH-type transcriptional regulator / antitoxin HigA
MATVSYNIPDRYIDLVQQLPLRPIRSDRELNRAVKTIDALLDQPKLNREQEDYLDVLGDLVKRYESSTNPIEAVSDAEMLAHLIEAKDVTQTEVSAATGIALSTICEILSGKRRLNRKHIGKLAEYFNVSPGAFGF